MLDLDTLIQKRDELRSEWRRVRNERLLLKKQLVELPGCKSSICRKEYKAVRKRQRGLSKEIRHIEKKIFRRLNEQQCR